MQDLMSLLRRWVYSKILLFGSQTKKNIILFFFQVSAHYNADPYKMLDQLKKMNLKHVKVAYGVSKKNKTVAKKEEKKVPEEDIKQVVTR